MQIPEIPQNESERLRKLVSYNILDTPSENDYDELVQLASEICQVPISLMTLVDTDRQWFKSRVGLEVPQTSREVSFCGHAITQDDLFIVENAVEDLRFHDNPLVVQDPKIQFYAGIPLKSPEGYNIGTLCVIDHKPRSLNSFQERALKVLANQIVNHLELRVQVNNIKNAYAELNDERDKFLRSNKIYQRLLSIVSHDVRGPLNSFTQLVQMLINDEIAYEQFKALAPEFQKNMSTTIQLLDNIVKWGTDKLSRKESVITTLNLRELVDKVFSNYQTASKLKSLELINKVLPDLTLKIDENIIRFILRNLVSNAIKFTEKGYVEISAKSFNNSIEIIVKDTGLGIPADIKENLFNWNNNKSRLGTNNEKGSGLGLNIIKEFIDQLDADIHVDTEINKGTSFIIRLPQ